MLDFIEVFWTANAPIQVHGVLEAFGAAVFDQTVDLTHASARGNQHQWTVRQFGQVRIAEWHVDPHHRVALQLFDQVYCTGFARQDVNFQITPTGGRRSQGKG